MSDTSPRATPCALRRPEPQQLAIDAQRALVLETAAPGGVAPRFAARSATFGMFRDRNQAAARAGDGRGAHLAPPRRGMWPSRELRVP